MLRRRAYILLCRGRAEDQGKCLESHTWAESGLWQWFLSETCSPVHLPMFVTATPNHYKFLLKFDSAGSSFTILKVKHGSTCVVRILSMFYRFSKRFVSFLYHVGNLLGTISPVHSVLGPSGPPTITMLSSCITTAAWKLLPLLKRELK